MKLLIIEGPDRTGKNTLINKFCNQAENHIVRHWGTANGDTDMEKRNFQYQFFKKEFQLASERNKFIIPDKNRYPNDIYIWNRSHIGEFVYGEMYRNTKPEDWVLRMEKDFSFDIDPSIYLVLLTATPEFLVKRDDGLSFSNKVADKMKEIDRFNRGFVESSIMNKMIVDVNHGSDFRDSDEIFNDINKFIFNGR